MNSPQPPKNHLLFWATVGLASVATAGLPLLAMAWWQTQKLLDDFGSGISPAAQWFSDWQTPAFSVIGLACMAAYAILCLSSRDLVATLLAMALATGAILTEVAVAVACIILPVTKLFRDLS